MTIALELSVEAEGWNAVPDPEGLIRRAFGAAVGKAGLQLAPEAEVSVLLCDDATIQELNANWRGKNAPTNVLSFPAAVPGTLAERALLGDIAIAWETTAREASLEGKPVANHLTHLAIHGFLHLVGYDHETETDAEIMEGLETRILAGLGIPDPYAGELAEPATT